MKKSRLIPCVIAFTIGIGLLAGCTSSPINNVDDPIDNPSNPSIEITPRSILSTTMNNLVGNKYEEVTSEPQIDVSNLSKSEYNVDNITYNFTSMLYASLDVASSILDKYGDDAYNNSYDISYTKDYTLWYTSMPYLGLSLPNRLALYTSENDRFIDDVILVDIDTTEYNGLWLYTMEYYIRIYYDKTTESHGVEFLTRYTEDSSRDSAYEYYYGWNGNTFTLIKANYPNHVDTSKWYGYCYQDVAGETAQYSEAESSSAMKDYFNNRVESITSICNIDDQLSKPSINATIKFDDESYLNVALPAVDSTNDPDDPDDPYKYIEDDGSITLSNQLELAKIIFSKLGTNTKTPEEAINLEYEDGLFDETEGTLLTEDDEIYTTGRSMIYSIDYVYTELLNNEGTNVFTSSYEVDYDIIFTLEEGSGFSSITLFAPRTIYYSSVVAYDGVYYFISSYLNASANGAIVDVLISYDPVSDEVYTQLYGRYPKLSGDHTYIDYLVFTDNLHPLMIEDLSSIMKPGVVFVDSTYKYVLNNEIVPDIYEHLIEVMNNQYNEYSTIEELVTDITRTRRIYYSSMTLDDIERDTGISYPRLDEELELVA